MMNKSLALFGVLSGMVFFTHLSFAKDETFNVYKKCHDEMEWSCDVIRNTNGKKEKVYGGMKSPNMYKCHVVVHVKLIVFYREINKKMMRLKNLSLLIRRVIV